MARSCALRLDKKATSISLLVALGARADGQKVLLAIKNMGGESEAAWRAPLDDLVKRGLILFQTIDLSSTRLCRTGARIRAFVQIWEWQVMQMYVEGIPALDETSTAVWQNRQSIPKPAT